MGRPLNNKFFGNQATAGSQIDVLAADLGAGNVANARIVKQTGAKTYILTDGVNTRECTLINATPTTPGQAQIVATPFASASTINVKKIKAHTLIGFDGNIYRWGVGVVAHEETFASTTAVDPTTDIITVTAHGWVTGNRVRLDDLGNTAPTGLVDLTYYYVIKVDADNVKLASSYNNAINGIPVNITADGVGNNKLVDASMWAVLDMS